MSTRRPLALSLLLSSAIVGVACAPAPGECASGADCAFGQVCLEAGVCAPVGLETPSRLPPTMVAEPSDLGALLGSFTTTGRAEGHIGSQKVEFAAVGVQVYERGQFATFVREGDDNVFIALQTSAPLDEPGQRVVGTDGVTTWLQACDIDAAYDEFIPSFDVEVSPPREATADDPIIAEDTTVVDVTVGVGGDGTDVTVDFVMPVL